MNPERWKRVLEIFQAALVLPEDERDEFVRSRAGDDAELREEVQRMLRVGSLDEDFLEPADPLVELPRRLGDFELLEELGRGGMGVVYRARQRSLDREVAVKVLPPSLALGERRIDRFRREARAVARLQHPGIVQVLTVGREDDTDYFAMELVHGHDLAHELVRLRADRGHGDTRTSRLPSSHSSDYLRTVARLMLQAADALQHAHDHGVVHRDVKPSNLLLDAGGALKVVDFGLARDASVESLSRSGDLAGTPYYMSPEQVRARRHLVDHRTDVYSLGVVLYELLTLRRPFDGSSSHEIMIKIVEREPDAVRGLNPRVSRDMATICETAMSKDLARRYSSAGAMRDDLQRFLDHQAIHARPIGPLRRLVRAVQRRRAALAAVGLVLVALAVGALVRDWTRRRARIERSEEAIASLVGSAGLAELLPGQLAALRGHLDVVATDADARARHAELFGDLDELRRDLRARGQAALESARDPSLPEGQREQSQLEGLQLLMHAAYVFPEDDELRRLAAVENTYPRLSVRVEGTGARVALREVDPWTSGVGERRELGPAPLEDLALLPGHYRVVVAFDDGGFREVFVHAGPANMDIDLLLDPPPAEDEVTRGMVRLPAARYTFADFDGEQGGYQGRSVDLEAFWIDRTEVSNAEYAAFVRATGHREPILWAQGGGIDQVVERWPDLPVTGVPWSEAAAYAAWVGKRLPTSAEWHYAAGGLENRPWPWSADPDAEPRGNVLADYEGNFQDADTWDEYVRRARPVDSAPDAATPEGVLHLYGNVAEWSESPAISLLDEETSRLHPFERFVWGGAWDVVDRERPLRNPYWSGTGSGELSHSIGFRCARSAVP